MRHFLFCIHLLFAFTQFGLAYSPVLAQEKPQKRQEKKVAGPDLAISSLTLTKRSATEVSYHCVVRNVGILPIAGKYLTMLGYLSPDRRTDGKARYANGRRVPGGHTLLPGETASATFYAKLQEGDFEFLVVKIRLTPGGIDRNPANDTIAIPLDAPLTPLPKSRPKPQAKSRPKPALKPQAKSHSTTRSEPQPTAAAVGKTIPTKPRASTPKKKKSSQDSIWVIVFIGLVGLTILGIFGLLGLIGFNALRPSQTFPLSFRRVTPDEANDEEPQKQAAEKMGFRLVERVPLELKLAIESLLGSGGSRLSHVMQRRVRSGTFTLCDVRLEHDRTGGTRDNRYTYTETRYQTVLIFTAARGVYFPPFTINPCWKPNEWLMRRLASRWFGQIRFEEDAEFHQKLLVGTVVPDAVRPLLSARVREEFKANAGLTTIATGQSIMIVPPDGMGAAGRAEPGVRGGRFRITNRHRDVEIHQTIHPADKPKFLGATLGIVNAIRKAEIETRSQRPSAAEVAEKASAYRQGPSFGTVSSEELDRLLRENPPRRISKAIRQATKSKFAQWLRLSGWICLLIPSGLMAVLWMPSFPESRVQPMFMLCPVMLLGFLLIAIPTWKRLRILSLLKRGCAVMAQVTEIKCTNTQLLVGDASYRRYAVTFEYSHEGKSYRAANADLRRSNKTGLII